MDDIDRRLLIHLERGIPLQSRPFEMVGKQLGIDGAEVLLRIHRLETDNLACFRARFCWKCLDLERHLLLMRFKTAEQAETAVQKLSQREDALRVFESDFEFNLCADFLWPKEGLDSKSFLNLKKSLKAETYLLLPGFSLLSGKRVVSAKERLETTKEDRSLIRMLGEKFPLADDPYRQIAEASGRSEDEIFKKIKMWQEIGFLNLSFAPAPKNVPLLGISWWRIPGERFRQAVEAIAGVSSLTAYSWEWQRVSFQYNLLIEMSGAAAVGTLSEMGKKLESKIGPWPHREVEVLGARFFKPSLFGTD